MSTVPSRLNESSTTTSSLHATESRQPARLTSSSSVRMRTETPMSCPSARLGRRQFSCPDDFRRMTPDDRERRHILYDDGTGGDERPAPDGDPRADECLGA